MRVIQLVMTVDIDKAEKIYCITVTRDEFEKVIQGIINEIMATSPDAEKFIKVEFVYLDDTKALPEGDKNGNNEPKTDL
jgi:hypothetical protein